MPVYTLRVRSHQGNRELELACSHDREKLETLCKVLHYTIHLAECEIPDSYLEVSESE